MSSRVRTGLVLKSKGYSYLEYVEPSIEPEYSDVSFSDVVEEFSSTELGSLKLYKHQYEAFEELSKGHSVVMVAGTGSGKTEAWFLYLARKLKPGGDFVAVAVYPTLALANDQVKRLEKYMKALGKGVVQLDSVKKEEFAKTKGLQALRLSIAASNLIVTNPAFLLHDLKKFFVRKESALLSPIYSKMNLLVIDELDFYSPRSLALLLATIRLLSAVAEKGLQVVALSAGLSNPEDLCRYLEEVTGRPCNVIRGRPFRVENHTYVVLGKNLQEVWLYVKKLWSEVLSKHPELGQITNTVENYEKFKSEAYHVLSLLESLGYEVPGLGLDPAEIVTEYFNDKYVTIVFTRSISTAEEFVRSVKAKYGPDAPIASHHHLVSKRLREEIEEKARRGDLKVIVSPRTLSQGIDIGLVARIVHLGLPDNVREFYQREGRKGRRRELGFSETVIIPYSRWDREILSGGLEVLKSWLELGLEKTLINPDNLYIYLFTGVVKALSPWYREDFNDKEREALRRAGVIDPDGRLNEKTLKRVFERLNFYEYAPPYGIKRYIEKDGKLIPLEPIGHCDLVEKFQPGCIDYSEDAIVISLATGRTSRHVKSVIEKDIRQVDFKQYDGLDLALEEYRYIKLKWGEKPQIIKDLLTGRITSEELCVVYVPKNGFGKYVKVPDRCIWTVRSEKPKLSWIGGKPVLYYEKKPIYVPMPTGGEYRDFTYGYSYSMDPRENADLVRLALAFIMVVLRRKYGIPFETIMYDVVKFGEYKYFSLHEPEAAGLIDKLDWLEVRKAVEQYTPDDLDRILVSELDDIAYSTLLTVELDWDLVKQYALRAVDYVLARERIRAVVKGRELYIPRPSPALKIASYVIASEVLEEESIAPVLLTGHGFYDGDRFVGSVDIYPPIPLAKPPQSLLDVESTLLDKLYYEEFKLLVENREIAVQQLKRANLRRLASFVEKEGGAVVDFSEVASQKGLSAASVEEVASAVGVEQSVNYARVREVLRDISEKKAVKPVHRDLLVKYMENRAKQLYIAYLVLGELSKSGNV